MKIQFFDLKLSKEIKTALIVILGILTFIWGFDFLKGSNLFKQEKVIYAVYDEVEGLVNGAKVSINGLSVGKNYTNRFSPQYHENTRYTQHP